MTAFLAGALREDSGELRVADVAIHPGEDAGFDRMWGGRMPSSKAALTASGAVGMAGGRKYHGYMVTTATTGAVTVYDNTGASGTVIDVIPASTAAGTYRECAIPCVNGIYAAFASGGTVLFLYS